MKRILKFTIMILTPLLVFISLAFTANDVKPLQEYKDFYIYVYCHDKDDYEKVYVSGMCHYIADDCGAVYNWRPKVEKAFKSYVASEYNTDPDYIYVIGSTTGNYLSSTQKANEALNKKISELKGKGHSITKTNFTHGCE